MKKLHKEKVNVVIDYIENNIQNDLSLESLAKVANFSPFHFHRIFKRTIGETPGNYIQRIRMEKAANLLSLNPKCSLELLTSKLGYSNSTSFCRSFKKHFNTTSKKWRKNIFKRKNSE